MATIAENLATLAKARQGPPAPVAELQQPSWVQSLIDVNKEEKRKEYKPIGFEFTRDPFDPSSYYRALGSFRDISRAATKVTETEVANKQRAEQEREYARSQDAIGAALGGVNANFTYNGSSKKYGLKGVSSHVAKMADSLGGKFGFGTIGGYRSHGSVPGSDHPKGLALDFMINRGKSQGNALANYAVKNMRSLGIKYVIWNRMIYNPSVSNSWRRYSGPSPHTDHVHISFLK